MNKTSQEKQLNMRSDDPGQKISMKATNGKPEHRWEKNKNI